MKLKDKEKRVIENIMITMVKMHPNGIDTRVLISAVMTIIRFSIPHANRYHVAGMLSWVWKHYNCTMVRTPGRSMIA